MSETNSPDTAASPGLAPLGGTTSPANVGLSAVGGVVPQSDTASTSPMHTPTPAPRPSVASLYDSPATATAAGTTSRFSTPTAPAPTPSSSAPMRTDDDGDAIPTGRLIGALVSGLLVGALCLLGWRWIWDNIHFNFSFIAIGVGFVIGFVMLSVAQKENAIVQLGAIALGLGYSVAGVWPSLASGRPFGIIFGVFCVILGAGAAAKAASGGADDSE